MSKVFDVDYVRRKLFRVLRTRAEELLSPTGRRNDIWYNLGNEGVNDIPSK
ncbi:MAG: hypothetical protein ABJA37_04370 [Ferruginibacter sp.]